MKRILYMLLLVGSVASAQTKVVVANRPVRISADSLNDGTTNKAFLATERTKLAAQLADSSAVKLKIRDSLNIIRTSIAGISGAILRHLIQRKQREE